MEDLIPDFLAEAGRQLDAAEAAFARLQDGHKPARDDLLRRLHTIRGAAGCVGLMRVEAAANACETIAAVGEDGVSRKLLQAALAGLRAHLAALAQGVPAAPAEGLRPLAEAWAFAPGFTADAAETLSKRIAFEALGGHIEIDAREIAAVRAALVHLVRNACDHGVEPPDERLASGKDPVGQIGVLAHFVRDGIAIDVADDGRGVTPEILDGLFTQGVSSASAAQRFSGAGVGLAAARAIITEIGGALELRRDAPMGACFRILLPRAQQPRAHVA